MMAQNTWTLHALIEAYEQDQQRTRGLRTRTLRGYVYIVRQFVRTILGTDPIDLTRLTPSGVVQFIASVQQRFCPASMKTVATSLRSFFRFLQLKDLCSARLAAAVPTVACPRLATLPRGLSDEQHERLVTSLGVERPCGRRDRAMVLCLATLGLRPGELAQLSLDDIDWRAGTVQLRTRKTGRGALLPLPGEVGRSLVEYLRKERPATRERRVFVRHTPTERRGEAITSSIVTGAVIRALRRAGIDAPISGAYVLRHTVASRMVRRGTSLKEVADFLGHRSLETTAIYAKVDLPALRGVALPWPQTTP